MSIRRYLVLTLFSVLTLITFIAAIQGYKKSMSHAEIEFDQQLLDLANTLIAINSASGLIAKNSNNKVIEVSQQSGFSFQVWQDEHLLFKSYNAPDKLISNDKASNKSEVNFFEINFLEQRWRAVSLTKVFQESTTAKITVIVAQPLQAQFALAQTLVLAAVTPIILAIVFLSFLIFAIITQGLKPLRLLSQELSLRKSNDFTPIAIKVHNNELAEIVVTLNNLFARLDEAFQRERHFASDAAHELKTPLSVLKIDTHNLIDDLVKRSILHENSSLTHNNIENFSSIKALNNSVDRMGHVIDQILNLNRTNPTQIQNASTCFNVNFLLKQVISELYRSILDKDQTITLESDDFSLMAHEFSIHLLAVNLISNANKYTPNGGEIIVSVSRSLSKRIVLSVEDSGAGIDPKEYQRVFDRFYRIGGDQHNSSTFGCGLGLSIVKHIAQLHGAEINLSQSTKLNGLKVEIYFPVLENEVGHSNV
jgi:two-component system sensor histidine kinase QseC